MGMTLLDIVRKWLKTGNRSLKWEINGNYLVYVAANVPYNYRILINESDVEFSGFIFKATDPKFFTKLNRSMDFIERYNARYIRNQGEFQIRESVLAKEMLKMDHANDKQIRID